MVHFACHCLNVQIHVREAAAQLQDVPDIDLTDKTATDSFFSPNTLVATLDLCGISKSQNLLCKERIVDRWMIITCTCCQFDVCAIHPDDHWRVLVNSVAKTNEGINALRQSNRYSQLFQLVLPEINDNFIQNNIGIEMHNRNLDSSVEHVQKLVSNYLTNEQKAMEERIRQFHASQQQAYADLLQKVRKQKQSMIYLLLKSKEIEAPHQNAAAAKSPLASPTAAIAKDTASNESSTSTDSAFDKSDASGLSYDRVPKKPNVKSLRRTMSHNPTRTANKPKKGPKAPRKAPVNIDVGGIFDMEEFDSKDEYSEEDSERSDGSNDEDSHHGKSDDQMVCATSLPMSIPTFSHYSRYNIMDDDEDDYKASLPKNPEDIAASMRALACSITDGTEMFGELPRRRLNTGELLASRPL